MRRALVGIALVVATGLGCKAPIAVPPVSAPSSRPAAASPTATATEPASTPSPSASLAPQPSETAGVGFGPLAVYETGNVVLMDGLIHGTLVFTSDCAFVDGEGEGDRKLIVWPDLPDFWRWDRATDELVSLRFGHDVRELRFSSGDQVRLGGADVPADIQAEMLESITWVAPPRDECMTSLVFFSNGEISEP